MAAATAVVGGDGAAPANLSLQAVFPLQTVAFPSPVGKRCRGPCIFMCGDQNYWRRSQQWRENS